MEGLTITKFESRARLDIDKLKIYLLIEECDKFNSILERLEKEGCEEPLDFVVEKALRILIKCL